jgi:hypothetical protein
MPGLVPGIHVLQTHDKEDVDGRDKPGHDAFVSLLRTPPMPTSSLPAMFLENQK